jgi:hypothetical protein
VLSLFFSNNAALTCSLFQSLGGATHNTDFADVELLGLDVASDSKIGPGTYKLGPAPKTVTKVGEAFFTSYDSTCTSTELKGTAGSITITDVTATTVKGSYDVTFGKSGSLSGSFDVDYCAPPDSGTSSSDAGTTCMKL